MDKLTETIPNFRVSEKVKKTIEQMASKDKRKLTEFIRIKLEDIVDDHLHKSIRES